MELSTAVVIGKPLQDFASPMKDCYEAGVQAATPPGGSNSLIHTLSTCRNCCLLFDEAGRLRFPDVLPNNGIQPTRSTRS